MARRLLNSSVDPHRLVRSLRLPRDLQVSLETGLEFIYSAVSIIDLSHAHGRAIGLTTGLGIAKSITRVQFRLLCELYERAFDDSLTELNAKRFCKKFTAVDDSSV